MIRLFKVYYPVRTLVLLAGEAIIVWTSFLLGTVLQYREDSYIELNFEYGYYKLLAVTFVVLLFSHWLDLYNPSSVAEKWQQTFRLLLVLGLVALALALIISFFPRSMPRRDSSIVGLVILAFALFGWRSAYAWLSQQPYLREKVYVLGTGERAQRLVQGLRTRSELGVEVVGWTGTMEGRLPWRRLQRTSQS